GEVVERLLGEAGAHLARVDEAAAIGVVAGHEQRADAVLAPALAGLPADDEELLAAHVLDLDPGAGAPARLVAGVQPLGDQPLEALLGGGVEQDLAVAVQLAGRLPVRPVELERLEALAALAEGKVHEGVAVEPEH